MKSKRLVRTLTSLVILSSVFATSASATIPSGTAKVDSVPYGYSDCSEPLSACNDYYSEHFDLDIFIQPVSNNNYKWNVVHAHTRLAAQNQNGDKWTTERIGIFSPSVTNIYNDTSKASSLTTATYTLQEFNIGKQVTKGDNIVMAYFKYMLYDQYGTHRETWYPKRYAQNF